MSEASWPDWVDSQLDQVRAAGRWRQTRTDEPGAGDRVSFASNDYLGLTHHPAVVAAAHEALDRWGSGAGGARLTAGTRAVHHDLEAALASWKHEDAAVVFPTGYAANLGVLSTFGRRQATILTDERNHASIIDGTRLAGARVETYRHADVEHLESLLAASTAVRTLVVTETVFSMDGDLAPLEAIAIACCEHDALLVLDEAHGVLQPAPLPGELPHLRVATLSKALGSLGGVVAGPRASVDLLVNRARPFIFSTATSPADAAAALAAVEIVDSPEGEGLRARLATAVERVAPGHPSPIIPVVLGDERSALAASAYLADRGLVVPAIRPPTVPVGTSRLRVSLSAAHTDDELDRLVEGLAEVVERWGPA